MKKILYLPFIAGFLVCMQSMGTDLFVNNNFSKIRNDFNSPIWKDAITRNKFTVFVDYKTKRPAKEKTEFKIASDGKRLYLLFKASDSKTKQITTAPKNVDGFINKFPNGDRIELIITSREKVILAFDRIGNKFESVNYIPAKYCGYTLKTKSYDTGWLALVSIKLSDLPLYKDDTKIILMVQVIRNVKHGPDSERSYSGSSSITASERFLIKEKNKI